MVAGFKLLMIGLVFVLADLRIRGINLLPDVIGYALLAFGAHILVPFAGRFERPRTFGWILVALALLLYVLPPAGAAVLEVIVVVLTIALIWTLFGGVMQFAGDRDRPDLERHAAIYRRIYIGLALATLLFIQLARLDPEAAGAFLQVMAAATLVLLAFMLRLLFVVKHELISTTQAL